MHHPFRYLMPSIPISLFPLIAVLQYHWPPHFRRRKKLLIRFIGSLINIVFGLLIPSADFGREGEE